MLQTQYNPGGRWSGGGTGGWTEGQVHVEVERLGTEAEPAGQSTKAEQETRVKPTEQGARTGLTEQEPTRAEQTEQEPARAEQTGQVNSSHLYLYSAFNNTNCVKATAQYQNRKIVCQ